MADQFQRTLAEFGFEWDGNVEFQSGRSELYESALDRLRRGGHCYPCRCSRSTLAGFALEPGAEPVYPGTCRDDPGAGDGPHALRFHVDPGMAPVEFDDAWQRHQRQDCAREAGDFVVRRRDGFHAYHLAVVVDDALQGVTEVVRGADLLSSTPRQMLLQRALGLPTPRYGHLPLLLEPDGRKLAKSRRAVPLDPDAVSRQLYEVLQWLDQDPPAALAGAPVPEIWAWAIPNWRPGRLVGRRERRLPEPRAKA